MIDVIVSAGIGLAVSIFAFAVVVLAATALAGRRSSPPVPRLTVPRPSDDLGRVLLRNFLESRRN